MHVSERVARDRLWAIAFAAGFFPIAVSAQVEGSNADSRNRLEEIVVTATKRETSVLDVPGGITALSGDTLGKIGANSFEDYARFVPGLSFIQRGEFNRSFQPNIRGVQLGRASPTTAFYIDETPLQPLNFERIGLPDPGMYDINRVEVLKGPQGTLYGASSMGGAIKVVPNRPNLIKREASFKGDVSRWEEGGPAGELSGMINIPVLEDVLALRLVGTYGKDMGYIKGVEGETFVNAGALADLSPTPVNEAMDANRLPDYLNEISFYQIRAAAAWTPNDRLTVTPSAIVWNVNEEHGRQISSSAYDADSDLLIFPIFDGVRAPQEQSSELFNVKFEYRAEWADIMASITSYETNWLRETPAAGLLSSQGVPLNFIFNDLSTSRQTQDGEEEQLAIEVRVSTNLAGAVNGTAGVFYRDLDRRYLQFQPGTGLETFLGGTDIVENDRRRKSLEEIGVFGEVTWKITDRFDLTGGLRWSDYERSNDTTLTGLFATPPVRGKVSESLTNYSVSASWKANGTTNFYARAAEGYRTGFVGLGNLPPICDQDLIDQGITPGASSNNVNADTLTDYEVGVKTRLFDDRLTLNAAAYQIDWEDVQIDIRLDCTFTLQKNAGQAEIQGFEIELEGNPADWLAFRLAVGQADSELTEDAPAVGGEAGEPLPAVGEWTYAGSLMIYPGSLSALDAYFRLDTTYSDQALYNFRTEDPRPRDIKEDLFLANLSFGLSVDEWDFTIYVKNALNDLERGQCRDTSVNIIGERITCTNSPRAYGLTVARSFTF